MGVLPFVEKERCLIDSRSPGKAGADGEEGGGRGDRLAKLRRGRKDRRKEGEGQRTQFFRLKRGEDKDEDDLDALMDKIEGDVKAKRGQSTDSKSRIAALLGGKKEDAGGPRKLGPMVMPGRGADVDDDAKTAVFGRDNADGLDEEDPAD